VPQRILKLVHWPLMGELLYLVQRLGTGCGRTRSVATEQFWPHPVNGECTNHCIAA